MRAYILLDDKYKKNKYKEKYHFKSNSVIIVTDKELQTQLINNYPNCNIEFINLFSDNNGEIKCEITRDIMSDLLKSNLGLLWKEYLLTDILVNQLFTNIEIIYNLIEQVDLIIKKYSITHLVLYGGHPDVQFLPLTLYEGERAFRFLYKRSWFINYFLNEALKDTVIILWEKKNKFIFLKLISIIRPGIILLGKLYLLFKKALATRRNLDKDIYDFNQYKERALFIVRNPIQVEPLMPIYYEFMKDGEVSPLFLSFENYSNDKLIQELEKNEVNYIDLYSYLTIYKIWGLLKEVLKIKSQQRKNVKIHKYINKYKISFFSEEIVRNLSPFIIDIMIMETLLEDYFKLNQNIYCLINNETHSYHSAIQAEWIKKINRLSIGIQHVAIGNKIRPKISRVDVMFMMSKKITDELSNMKKDENFIYLGPSSYDLHFNTTNHIDSFQSISIFTQPDDYKNDYIEIIDDISNIINLNNKDLKLNIKLHPREKDYLSFKRFIDTNSNINIYQDDISSNELIKDSDLVISIHSGVIMQSIIIGTPTMSINYSNKHDIKFDFINHDVTKKITSKKELEFWLLNLEILNKEYYLNRKLFLNYNLEGYSGNASEKIYNYIKKENRR